MCEVLPFPLVLKFVLHFEWGSHSVIQLRKRYTRVCYEGIPLHVARLKQPVIVQTPQTAIEYTVEVESCERVARVEVWNLMVAYEHEIDPLSNRR